MGKILTKSEILEYWLRSGGSQTRLSYAMNILLGRKIVERVASGVYIVTSEMTPLHIGDQYWKIINALIQVHSPSGGIIGGEKALELHLHNYSIPEILIIYTRDTAMRIRLIDNREVHFRTLVSGTKTGKKNLWRTIGDHAIWIEIPEKIQLCGKELALLESLSLRQHDNGIEEANIVRFLRTFHRQIDRQILGELSRYRYIRPLNRLRVICRDLGYEEVYIMTREIIRNEGGGCYLNL
ncbi:hypothetical protein HOO68_06495 [Candidatus Gracilibacteria bacterium]|nr:hypothetical protein [Candidatus Gracilibacteria bacterium]